jgi:hypothetical protein
MPVRTQIGLSSEDHRRAKQRAAELNISLAEYVRRLVARDLGELRPAASPELLFDLGRTEGSDIARHKDEYVGDAVESPRSSRGED